MDLLEKTRELIEWQRVPETAVALFNEKRAEILEAFEKDAYSPTLRTLGESMNLLPGKFPGGIPNAPSPLASMLVSGMAGGALGYGLGTVGEAVLPKEWKRRRLRRTLALLGAGAGMAPGAAWGMVNMGDDRNFNDPSLITGPASPYQGEKTAVHDEIKQSYDNTGLEGSFTPIPVNEFNQIIWKDPRVSRPLSPAVQAAATGLVTGAANLPGRRNVNFVTPMDIGRMAAGMGSGYLSGALVGKALGTMMGMPPSTQDRLKSTGMWAGMVANLVPIAFGG